MMSMVGIELIKFIDPNLTWKTASKGSKGASRRVRKVNTRRSFKVGVDHGDRRCREVENISVSESEKLGVDILSRRFADKAENVPIKKRKILYRSSPPPQNPSLHSDVSVKHVNSHCTSGQSSPPPNSILNQQGLNGGVVNRKISVVEKDKSCWLGFSGIEMLAEAACISMQHHIDIPKDVPAVENFSIREGIDSFSSTTQSQVTVISSLKNSESEDDLGVSLPTVINSEKSVSSQYDRSHWDLNTSVDAWERPCAEAVGVQTNVINTTQGDHIGCENQKVSEKGHEISRVSEDDNETTLQSVECKGISADVHSGIQHEFSINGNQINAQENCVTPFVVPLESACIGNQSIVINDATNQDNACIADKIEVCPLATHEIGKTCSGKMLGSDDFNNCQQQFVGEENVTGQEDYESEFEDGEVRDSLVHCWEDSEPVGNEIVNYGSKSNIGPKEFSNIQAKTDIIINDAVKKPVMDIVFEEDKQFSLGNTLKDSSHSVCTASKMSAWGQKWPVNYVVSSDISKEAPIGDMIKNGLNSHVDSDSRRPYHISHKNHSTHLNLNISNGRHDTHMHGGRRVDKRQWDDRSFVHLNFNRHHPPSYDDIYDSIKHRHKSVLNNSDPELMDEETFNRPLSKSDDCSWRSHVSTSRSAYRAFVRRKFTAERDNDHHFYRSRRDPYESFEHVAPHLTRRDRSFSPMLPREFGRIFRPRGSYKSRSRSRSPNTPKRFLREDNPGFRRISRSPDFRPRRRIEKVRRSDYGMSKVDGFRNRRSSPTRMFGKRSGRFNSLGSPYRSRLDSYLSPTVRLREVHESGCVGKQQDVGEEDIVKKS